MQENAVKPWGASNRPIFALKLNSIKGKLPPLSREERECVELMADGMDLRSAARRCGLSSEHVRQLVIRPDAKQAFNAEREAAALGSHAANAAKTVQEILSADWTAASLDAIPASVRSKLALGVLNLAQRIAEKDQKEDRPADISLANLDDLEAFAASMRSEVRVEAATIEGEWSEPSPDLPEDALF